MSGHTQSCGCLQKQRASECRFADLSNQKFGKLIALYPTTRDKHGMLFWKCKCECGNNNVEVRGCDLTSGHCKSCGCLSSKGNFKISQILLDNNYIFEREKTFDNCINPKTGHKLRFDFYLPDYNCCIEYDGEQHYKEYDFCRDSLEERQERDNIKNQYCENNSIKLIRIPYWDYNKITNIYLETLLENKTD